MMRHILLIDMNAFYITCESLRDPRLAEVPAAVAGDPKTRTGIILTSNYIARKQGVRTAMTLHQAMQVCPGLVCVKPDMPYYDHCSEEVFRILERYSPMVEKSSIDEGYVDVTGSLGLFGSPRDIAVSMMETIKGELGLLCSIGISENKFLAKMASEFKKPLGIVAMYKKDIAEMMWPLPLQRMVGVGKKTVDKLNRLGFHTIGDIALSSREFLTGTFMKYGTWLHMKANGIDEEPVLCGSSAKNESIGRSTTLPLDITDILEAKKVIAMLADEVACEARGKNLKGKTVQLVVKYSDFHVITRQKTLEYTHQTRDIVRAGHGLLEGNWDPYRPVRLLGISLSHLDRCASQMSMFEESGKEHQEKLDKAMDGIRKKFGDKSVDRGNTL
ncbi:MAG: DNA polymerase IV [Clostridia bacterium]